MRDASGQALAIYDGTNTTSTEYPIYGASRLGINKLGGDSYELTDHLGNVRVVVEDDNTAGGNLIGRTDYYPFGMAMPYLNMLGDYRYAYQGQEKDPETQKEAFQLRLWDGRIGRWLTTDPYGQYSSPYLGMGNNPVNRIDPDGGVDLEVQDCCDELFAIFSKVFKFAGFADSSEEVLEIVNYQSYATHITDSVEEALVPDAYEFNVQVTVPLPAPTYPAPFQNVTFGGSIYIDSYGNTGFNGNYGVEFDFIPTLSVSTDASIIYALNPGEKLHLSAFQGEENNYDLAIPAGKFDLNLGYFDSPLYQGYSIGVGKALGKYNKVPDSFFSYSRTNSSNPVPFSFN